MRRLAYVVLDVFTEKPLQGNQLAVFTDGSGLTTADMQALARETNLSETTFILPRSADIEHQRGVSVRIFTIQEELPFAGHPTLGTAMHLRGGSGAKRIELELKIGKIPVAFEDRAGHPSYGEMTQRDPDFGSVYPREELARVAKLKIEDIRDDVPCQMANTGMPFLIVPLRSLDAMRRLNLDMLAAEAFLAKGDAKFIYFVTEETMAKDAALHARMFFYNGEDPATGSASGCCIAWAVKHGVVPPGRRVVLEQGMEMGRASRIHLTADREGDRVVNVRVGGNAVEVARGEFLLP